MNLCSVGIRKFAYLAQVASSMRAPLEDRQRNYLSKITDPPMSVKNHKLSIKNNAGNVGARSLCNV